MRPPLGGVAALQSVLQPQEGLMRVPVLCLDVFRGLFIPSVIF